MSPNLPPNSGVFTTVLHIRNSSQNSIRRAPSAVCIRRRFLGIDSLLEWLAAICLVHPEQGWTDGAVTLIMKHYHRLQSFLKGNIRWFWRVYFLSNIIQYVSLNKFRKGSSDIYWKDPSQKVKQSNIWLSDRRPFFMSRCQLIDIQVRSVYNATYLKKRLFYQFICLLFPFAQKSHKQGKDCLEVV